jgi:CheY-like chemotaxis protein
MLSSLLNTDVADAPSGPAMDIFRETPFHILLVEDDATDAALTAIALEASGVPCTLERMNTGANAVSRLTCRDAFAERPAPDIVLLDLGLPGRDGFEILAELSALPPSQRRTPIAILTGHRHLDYLKRCYDLLPVVDYLAKPCSAAQMQELLTRICR